MKSKTLALVAPLLFLLSATSLDPAHVFAQQTPPRCQPPALSAPSSAAAQNIFTPAQEADLGDAVAEHVGRSFRVVEDAELNAHLRRVGAQLVKQLPETGLTYQFFLADLPDVNAFTLPGGRIYVSRKLVAFAREEDELAGVLAHELGHAVARQSAIEMTRMLREVLGVTAVTNRADIFDKYNQLVENAARKPKALSRGERHEEREQYVADQIGLYALVAAGYDPQAQASFWERVTETKKGDTGGFFSNLFGTTKPESRRLREMLKTLETLPAECRQARDVAATAADFRKWQASVVNYASLNRKEALRGVVSKIRLEPALRGDITHLKFSPDGKHVIAQDDSGISVLTREPLAPLFRVEAPEAEHAQFSPDSQEVVFHNSALRVETWSIADAKQKSVRELYLKDGCIQTALAPDGKALACLESDFALTLLDVATGEMIHQKKSFYKPNFADLFRLQLLSILSNIIEAGDFDFDYVSMNFSPDARYFAAGQRIVNVTAIGTLGAETTALGYDLTARAPVSMGGQLKKLVSGKFAFVAPDRIVAVNPENGQKSGIVKFPSGEFVEQFALGGTPSAAARGNYLALRPFAAFPVAVFDLSTKKILLVNQQRALDVYEETYVSERVNGELALFRFDVTDTSGDGVKTDTEMLSKVVLPRNQLGNLRAAAVSPDLKWLAVSERSRGAVWDLQKGERVMHVRGFRGAHFADDGALYADFPQLGDTARTIARMNPSTREAVGGINLDKESAAHQHGPVVVMTKYPGYGSSKDEKEASIEIRDARGGASLWSKRFDKEMPRVWAGAAAGGAIVLAWPTSAKFAKAEAKADPQLGARLAALREKDGDYLLHVLDARTGATLGKLLIETGKGSFRVRDVTATREWVIVSDTENRVLVYSLATGEQRGRVFGHRPAVSPAGNLFVAENERGQLIVYDLSTVQKRDELVFPGPVALARFTADGKRLFVLTADQTAYLLDIGAQQTTSSK